MKAYYVIQGVKLIQMTNTNPGEMETAIAHTVEVTLTQFTVQTEITRKKKQLFAWLKKHQILVALKIPPFKVNKTKLVFM